MAYRYCPRTLNRTKTTKAFWISPASIGAMIVARDHFEGAVMLVRLKR